MTFSIYVKMPAGECPTCGCRGHLYEWRPVHPTSPGGLVAGGVLPYMWPSALQATDAARSLYPDRRMDVDLKIAESGKGTHLVVQKETTRGPT